MSTRIRWWGAPKNFMERKNERKISWLELFYDLVYVAAIGQLTHHLAAYPSWHSVMYCFLLFALIFWSWVNGSQYYDLHGQDGIRTRLLTFWQMLAVASVAITIPDALAGHHQSFSITFMMVQFMITYLWWSVGLYDPSHRKFNIFYTVNYVASFFLLLLSVFVSYETAVWLWLAVLLFNITPPFTVARTVVGELKKQGRVFTASAAIVERFGLFTIIVMTESILSTVTGIEELHNKEVFTWIAFILGIFIAFLLWSIYFDLTSEQETKTGYSYMQCLIFLHLPLLAALSLAGACIKMVLINMDKELPWKLQWMFCISLFIILYSIVGITKIMKEEEEDRSYIQPVSRLLLLAGICILLIPVVGTHLHTVAFMSILAFILAVPVLVGIRSWIRYRVRVESDSEGQR